jgi:hypothetical protein
MYNNQVMRPAIAGRRLLVVEASFEVKGHGLVLLPGFQPEGQEAFRAGDPILLWRPDGSAIATRIGSLELLTPNPRHDVVILLKGFAKDDVPVGAEVWSVGEA